MVKKSLLLLLTLTIFFVIGCSKDDTTGPSEQVNEFKLLTDLGDAYFGSYTTPGGKGVNISIADMFPILNDGDDSNDPYIIDWRSESDFNAGHIKNAHNMALGDLISKIEDGTIPADKTILNICYTGQTASWATAILNMLGYEAQNLLFGMCGVTTDADIPGTGNWSSQIAADEFADQLTAEETLATQEHSFPKIETSKKDGKSVLKEQIKDIGSAWGRIAAADVFANLDNYFIINYWPQAEYVNPGHIPGSVCYAPKDAFKANNMLKYLPTDKTIVVYCYTGQTSAQITAYLQALGYDAKSLLYGVNGFAYNSLSKSKYSPPVDDYSAIIVK